MEQFKAEMLHSGSTATPNAPELPWKHLQITPKYGTFKVLFYTISQLIKSCSKGKVSQPLAGQSSENPGVEKYRSVERSPAGWRSVGAPATSAPGRRQRRAAEWARTSAWTEPFIQPEPTAAGAGHSLFLSRTATHGESCDDWEPSSGSAAQRRRSWPLPESRTNQSGGSLTQCTLGGEVCASSQSNQALNITFYYYYYDYY